MFGGVSGAKGSRPPHRGQAEIQRELRAVFNLCDLNGDNQVSLPELLIKCKAHTVIGEFFMMAQFQTGGDRNNLEQLFGELDVDGNGKISWDEFKTFFLRTITMDNDEGDIRRAICSIALRLMKNHGLPKAAAQLQREAGMQLDEGDFAGSQELLHSYIHQVNSAQTRQRHRVDSIREDMLSQQRRLGDMCGLMQQMRSSTLTQSVEIGKLRSKDMEIKQLEAEFARCQSVKQGLNQENALIGEECAELRRVLAEQEASEEALVADLSRTQHEAARLRQAGSSTLQQRIMTLLRGWSDRGGAGSTALHVFTAVDQGADGHLHWANHEIRNFVLEFFRRIDVPLPSWPDVVWFDLYHSAALVGETSLDRAEAVRFAQHCLEAITHNLSDKPVHRAAYWARTYRKVPVLTSPIRYSQNVIIDIREFASHLSVLTHSNAQHRDKMVLEIESGRHASATLEAYHQCDRDQNSHLSWVNGEVKEFIHCVYRRHGLVVPNEQHTLAAYQKFQHGPQLHQLDAYECVCMADALLRGTFFGSASSRPSSVRQSEAVPKTSVTRRSSGSTTATAAPVKRASTTRKIADSTTAKVAPRRSQTDVIHTPAPLSGRSDSPTQQTRFANVVQPVTVVQKMQPKTVQSAQAPRGLAQQGRPVYVQR